MTGLAIVAFGLGDGASASPAAPVHGPDNAVETPLSDPIPETPAPAPSAWAVADEARRETARRRLAAVTRSEALHAAGAPWAGANSAAGAEAGVSAPTVARWRCRVAVLLDRPGVDAG